MTDYENFDHYQGNDKVILISNEQHKFHVKKSAAEMSVLVKTMTEDDDVVMDEEINQEDMPEVPLNNVNDKALLKVIEFCQYHDTNGPMKEIEKPLTDTDLKKIVSEWDGTFIQTLEQEALFELILAANYMDIKPLLDLACAQVATQIKGKSPEEIREQFNIVNDFTPEEEAQIREENKWCTD